MPDTFRLDPCHYLIAFDGMKQHSLTLSIFSLTLVLLLVQGCKKDEEFENPFDQDEDEVVTDPGITIPGNNFAWIQENVFAPTCANSGCHDGTFEPDFRSISSSYNSLVLQPVIQNNQANSFVHRVVPGDTGASLLHERLTVFIPNTSGIMPLSLEPDSDWPTNKATYIAAIEEWILNGCLDVFGNPPGVGNLNPQIIGMQVYPTGSTTNAYPRSAGSGVQPVEIPQGSTVDVWFGVEDDSTAVGNLTVNELKVSQALFDFSAATTYTMSIESPVTATGFAGNSIGFTHRGTIDLSSYAAGTMVYLRTYIQDESHPDPAEIPNDGTNPQLRDWFSILII